MHRRYDADSWSHVGEQNTLQIRLQGKKGPPASAMRWYSWVANPGSDQNPWHHQAAPQQRGHSLKRWARVKHIPALQLSFWRVPPQFPSFGPRSKEGKVEERQSRVQKIICESMKSFDSNFRADLKTFLLLSPCVAPLSASFQHFPARMILMVQSVAEGTVTFHAGACQIRAAYQLLLSSLVTKCHSIYF